MAEGAARRLTLSQAGLGSLHAQLAASREQERHPTPAWPRSPHPQTPSTPLPPATPHFTPPSPCALRRPRPAPPSPCERVGHALQDAQLNEQLAQAEEGRLRAVEEGRQARQEADEVEARLASKEGRYDALLEKVRVAREARGALQQQLEAREEAIVRLRGELTQAQGQLSEAVEGRVATEAASRASGDELQRVHAELKVLQLRLG